MKAATAYTEMSHTPQGGLYTVSYPNNTLEFFFLVYFLNFTLFLSQCQFFHQPEANTKRTCVTTTIGLLQLR